MRWIPTTSAHFFRVEISLVAYRCWTTLAFELRTLRIVSMEITDQVPCDWEPFELSLDVS